MMILDHLALTSATLEEGVAHVEDALGVHLDPGGEHPLMGTHNRLLGLGREYFEVIAINPDAPGPDHPRWFDMDRFTGPPRLTNWIAAVPDVTPAIASAPKGIGQPMALTRGDLSWTMVVPEDGVLPFDNMFPALISWQSATHPTQRLTERNIRLAGLEISHPQAGDLRDHLPDLALDGRISFSKGAPGFSAAFDTPSGRRHLE